MASTESSNRTETIVCELTGVGRGGIATIALRGPVIDGLSLAQSCLQDFFLSARRTAVLQPGRVVYGSWRSSGESVVVTVIDAEHVQVHCHGGRAAVERILSDLTGIGAVRCDWPRWLAACGASPLEVEARQVLAHTTTRRTAAIAYDQARGAMRIAATDWLQRLTARPAELAAVQAEIHSVIAFDSLGQHLATPWQIVLAGPPNVGKSSLLNALLGYRRAITFDAPGTTRDVLVAETVLDGWPVTLSDTAGLRDSGDAIESQGVARAKLSIESADLVLMVEDARQPPSSPQPMASPHLIVRNKIDLLAQAEPPEASGGAVATAAISGQGVAQLIERIVQHLVPVIPASGQAVAVSPRQASALRAAAEADSAPATVAALGDLLGLTEPPQPQAES